MKFSLALIALIGATSVHAINLNQVHSEEGSYATTNADELADIT
jgi:hypothetical protein